MAASQNWFLVVSESGQSYKARICCNLDLYTSWTDKALHGQFAHNVTSLVDSKYQWEWLQHSGISKEVEAFLFAAQEQAIPTNVIKNRIYSQTNISPSCRLCGHLNETIDHLISSWSFIAQSAYKHRHDKVAQFLHWKLAAKYHFEVNSRWWKHCPDVVLENPMCKILWIMVDRPIYHNRPDIVVVNKQTNKGYFIDVTIPGDARIRAKTLKNIVIYRLSLSSCGRCRLLLFLLSLVHWALFLLTL